MSAPATDAAPRERKGALIQSREIDYKEIALRVSLVLLNLGAIGLLWWSLQRVLLPLQNQVRETNNTVSRLIGEVDNMDRQWSKPAIEEVRTKYGDVRSWMFVGQPAVEEWIGNVKQQVIPLVLDAAFDFSKSEPANPGPAPTNAPALVPTALALKLRTVPGVEANLPSYQRILQLCQALTAQEKRVDLVELIAGNGSNSVENAVVVLHLWSAEESELQ